LTLSIASNFLETRYLAGPFLIWGLIQSIWGIFVPMIMGRDLKSVAPNAPGNFKSIFNIILQCAGILDEYVLFTGPLNFI
jgi:hypothetical protein